jgi:hypothetical protein
MANQLLYTCLQPGAWPLIALDQRVATHNRLLLMLLPAAACCCLLLLLLHTG